MSDREPVLLSGGNPQIAKGDGDAPVASYIAALPGWKQAVGAHLDELIVRAVPSVRKAVRWNTPFYRVDEGWFLGFHATARYMKIAFFRGALLQPPLPVNSKDAERRYLHIHEGEAIDDARVMEWVRQASELPGVRL